MKKQVLNPQHRQQMAQAVNAELDKMTMSWTNELRDWHAIALHALHFASATDLNIPQERYGDLLKVETHGINMNIVALLANNLEGRTPNEMEYGLLEWADILKLNSDVAQRWLELAQPVQNRVLKQFELTNVPTPSIIAAQ